MKITGWRDAVLLDELIANNQRGGLVLTVGLAVALGGLVSAGYVGWMAYSKHVDCAAITQDPISYCSSHSWLLEAPDSQDGAAWVVWARLSDEERCARAMEGRSAYDLCAAELVAPSRWQFAGIGALLGGLGIVMVISALVLRARAIPFVRVLSHQRDQVVWIYGTELRHGRGGAKSFLINVGLADGRRLLVHTGNIREPARALDEMRALVPQATIGYTRENEQSFRRDPRSLRRG